MTNRTRVLASLRHQQPDKVPYHIGFTVPAHAKMVQYYGDPDFESKIGNCLFALAPFPRDIWVEGKENVWQDAFGVQWDRSRDKDIGNVCNRVVNADNVHDFPLPDPDEPSRYASFAKALRDHPDQFPLANLGFSLFERAWSLAGMEDVLMAMAADKDFINALLDRILELNLRVIDNCCRYDIDAMMFGDDWGEQRGVLMGTALWREFIKPRTRLMYQRVKSHGKFVFIHSCGKVDVLFPDLIECGLDVFNPFQPEVMDVFEMKKKYGGALSFYGGISTQRTLPYGTPAEVRDEVRRLIDVVGANGGYIASPAHAIPGDAKPENIAAMIETLQEQ